MGRILFILLAIMAIPWIATTWWSMRKARSARERSFIGRTSLTIWTLTVLAAVAVTMIGMRGQLIALPILLVGGLIIRHGLRKARARIQAEESDPLARAKRIN